MTAAMTAPMGAHRAPTPSMMTRSEPPTINYAVPTREPAATSGRAPAPAPAAHPITPAAAPAPAPARGLVVTTDGLTRAYNGVNAVDGLNLRVPAGGIYGFLGPNGAGKSTTMKLLLGLTRPTSGHMSVLGRPVGAGDSLPPGAIGSLIEGPSYYPSLTGKENLAMVASYLGLGSSRVEHALATVHLTGHGDKQAKNYSMGMKQRLGLAMALLADPSLILLDEPTNGLDPAGVAEIRELIVSLARQEGVTVIVSSHILSEIEQMADTVGIICAGRLRYQGPLSGLRDEGVIEMIVSAPTAVSGLLGSLGLAHEVHEGVVRTAMLPDDVVGELITRIVASGTTVYRVQTVRKTLEQAFLELTEPAAARTTARTASQGVAR